MSVTPSHESIEAWKQPKPLTSVRRRILSILIAAPALLVPAIVAFAIYWARQKFYQENAAAFVTGSPTISRAISEPSIAEIFAVTISFTAPLLTLVCWRIVMLYRATIAAAFREDARGRRRANAVLALGMVGQACSIGGMVSLSWLSEKHLHIGSSYVFFFGQAFAILCTGLVCLMLLKTPVYDRARGWPDGLLSPTLSWWRARIAPVIAVMAVVFWIMFLVRDALEPAPYWLHRTFSALEIIFILSFLGYLATFSLELYRWHSRTIKPD